MEWQPLSRNSFAEVQFDHFTGGRFSPTAQKFLRWRPEKDPQQCTMKQVQRENRSALDLLWAQPICSDHYSKAWRAWGRGVPPVASDM